MSLSLFACLVIAGVALYIALYTHVRAAVDPRLEPETDRLPEGTEAPLVSVIIPARNEERNIEACLRSFLDQTYPNLEIIVYNDRSEDGTEAVARRVAEEAEKGEEGKNIKIINGESLPEGWVGQIWGNVRGAEAAKGRWLLFTDADTQHSPRQVEAAVSYCLRENADFLSLYPAMEAKSIWERIVQPFVFWSYWLWYSPAAVANPRSEKATASGVFIMARRETYEESGGWEKVKDCIPDDFAFAESVKHSGGRTHMILGVKTMKVRMYRDLAEIWEGWNRYFLSGMDNSVPLAVVSLIYYVGFNILPFAVLPVALLAGKSLIALSSAAAAGGLLYSRIRSNRLFHVEWWSALLHPAASLIVTAVVLNSLYRRFTGRGIRWKDRVYVPVESGFFGRGKRFRRVL